jgi:hypothetical protein
MQQQHLYKLLTRAALAGTHANVETVLRDYLAREWAAREGVSVEAGIEIFGHSGKRLSAVRAITHESRASG